MGQESPKAVATVLEHPIYSKLIKAGVLLVIIVLSFTGGYFFSKHKLNSNSQSTSSIYNNQQTSRPSQSTSFNFPIDTGSSAVKSLWIVYSLAGVVYSISPTTQNNLDGYQILISSPTGPLVNQFFFASDKATNIVSLDKTGKETKYLLSNVKKGDSVQISYQINITGAAGAQVTKVAILK